MSEDRTKFVNKGRSEPIKPLVEQGHVTLANARSHKADLLARGLKEDQLTAFEATLEEVEAFVGSTEAKREESKSNTRSEARMLSETKAFIRELRLALPLALRDAKIADVTEASFFEHEPVGRSTRRIVVYLDRISPHVYKLEEAFKPYLAGKSATKTLQDLKGALLDADASQETVLQTLPQATQAYYDAKGRLLQFIEDTNRIGRLAYSGQAEVASVFNKDLLQRGRMGKAAPKP